ncbi:MAG: radical SAM family heme chaperone HemW [Pseudomonadales bacterium]
MIGPIGLYAHFPWCVRKCPYCDFNSHPLRGALDEASYLAALQADARDALAQLAPGQIASVFFGGGTPSLFSPEAFAELLARLRPWLASAAEVTMEANPGTVEHHDFAGYRRAGINRLSLGAQSFEPQQLRSLGRIHDAEDTTRAFATARRAGFDNINLDLMYGLPQQTPGAALADLRAALELGPEHLSWYQLTIEAKTEFARRPPMLASESATATMEAQGHALLAEHGYRRYEVSGYARAGFECRHNVNYWTFGDYLGIGAGAHGKLTSGRGRTKHIVRTRKPSQPRLYMAAPLTTERVPVPHEELVFEFMMNALRLTDGVDWEVFEARTGLDPGCLEPTWERLAAQGLVRRHRIATTDLGYRYLDGVLERFLT